MKRIVIGGLLAGLIYFLWVFISHSMLPFHNQGATGLMAADSVMVQLRHENPEPGIYYWPAMPDERNEESMQAINEKSAAGPVVGMMVWRPAGVRWMDPMMFVKNLIAVLLAGLIIAWMASFAAVQGASFGRLALISLAAGTVVALSGPVVNWIYYFFTPAFILPVIFDQLIGWGLGGLAIAWQLGKLAPGPQATPRQEAPVA